MTGTESISGTGVRRNGRQAIEETVHLLFDAVEQEEREGDPEGDTNGRKGYGRVYKQPEQETTHEAGGEDQGGPDPKSGVA